ncbi:cytochrome c oxidase assembly protein COX15 homolog isoform X1 [Ixodes scapularis]|nr:cytochrome c oxidase assembly protein COX15 homolog isoform X1 [Ixodes scapularis]
MFFLKLCARSTGPQLFRVYGAKYHVLSRNKPLAKGAFQGFGRRIQVTVAQPLAELSQKSQKVVGGWLLVCSGMAVGSIILGGVTRLTKSGLSMVHWHPFAEFPPSGHKQWEQEFLKYQEYPEYKEYNQAMTLSEFKRIWYIEYLHRMWGRTIGAVFYTGASWLWWRGWLSRRAKGHVAVLGVGLAFQGALGWFMVRSGLHDQPHVSQYRLAAHLGTALLWYSLSLWSAMSHLAYQTQVPFQTFSPRMSRGVHGVLGLVFVTAMSGALVAGLQAGLVYNSFPKMADRWVPSDILALEPKLRNFTENPTTVQFDHRILGESVVLVVTGLWLWGRKQPLPPRARKALHCLLAAAWLQATLGVSTLLTYVPVSLASSHQAGAVTLLSVALWLAHELKLLRRIPK